MFVDLSGAVRSWWNVDHIIKIEDTVPPITNCKIVYTVTFTDGFMRGITEEEFKRIMNVSDGRK